MMVGRRLLFFEWCGKATSRIFGRQTLQKILPCSLSRASYDMPLIDSGTGRDANIHCWVSDATHSRSTGRNFSRRGGQGTRTTHGVCHSMYRGDILKNEDNDDSDRNLSLKEVMLLSR
eukprot:scaffold1959_cov77-Skeletonema_marinoi.AAC.1